MSEAPPSCSLDTNGLRDQGARYARLATAVAAIEREPTALAVAFTSAVDRALLEEALEVERRCCPFFTLHYDISARRLRASVADPEHAPALDALASALGAAPSARA